jgi:SAM-dependent methyltransferase
MQSESDAYATIAAWYDVEHNGLTEDIECYLSLLAAPPSGRATVLEVGSGTGRIAAALATAGHVVTGVEPSSAMRARCAARLAQLPPRVAQRVRVASGSATEPGLAEEVRFDTVLFGLNTFAHLTSGAERHAALAHAQRHLRPGGQLLVDLDLIGPRRLLEAAGLLWWQGAWPLSDANTAGTQLVHLTAGLPGRAPGTVEVVHMYDVHASAGAVTRTTAHMTLALLTYGEMDAALARAGFTLAAAHGGYDLAPYEAGSSRLIIEAHA